MLSSQGRKEFPTSCNIATRPNICLSDFWTKASTKTHWNYQLSVALWSLCVSEPHRTKLAKWFNRLEVGAVLAVCLRWRRPVPFPKPHNPVTVWVSTKHLPRKRAPQKSLLSAASRLSHRTQTWQSGLASSQGTWKCTPLSRAVTRDMLVIGKMAFGSSADFLVSQADWTPNDLYQQMLCRLLFLCLLLWNGYLCMGEGVLQLRCPLASPLLHVGSGPPISVSLPFLPVSMWLLL